MKYTGFQLLLQWKNAVHLDRHSYNWKG